MGYASKIYEKDGKHYLDVDVNSVIGYGRGEHHLSITEFRRAVVSSLRMNFKGLEDGAFYVDSARILEYQDVLRKYNRIKDRTSSNSMESEVLCETKQKLYLKLLGLDKKNQDTVANMPLDLVVNLRVEKYNIKDLAKHLFYFVSGLVVCVAGCVFIGAGLNFLITLNDMLK